MAKQLKLDVIDNKRKRLLPLLKEFKDEFYLAGGTALAIQLGHRESIDFDFFSTGSFDPSKLQQKTGKLFIKYKTTITQLEPDTLSVLIDDEIKISFFKIESETVLPLIDFEWLLLCNELEIGAMKIIALMRAAYRDYVDLYFLIKKYELKEILNLCEKKYSGFEKAVYLKALLSFEDIEVTPIKYIKGKEKTSKEIFSFLEKQTKIFLSKNL
ncbi:MAG: nucleotidyl transferase AbiEii/AbiGii toxin family protein [Ignavibacteriaceae bacterium]